MSFLDNVRDWFCNIVHHDDFVEVEVVRGDTLWAIVKRASGAKTHADARRHVDQVLELNPDVSPGMIHPGDKIKLPRSWA